MNCYILCWEFGTHHVNVSVSKKDFFRVVDSMSKEFTIHKTFDNDDHPDAIFYHIENYCGDFQMIGFCFNLNE